MATDQARIRVRRPGYRPDVLTLIGILLVILFGFWLLVNFIKEPADFYNLFLIGLTNGCIYGLVAIGYSLVYGILELINFAHGDVFMLGSWVSFSFAANRLGLGKGEKDSLVPRTCTWDLAKPGDTVRVWMQDSIGLAVLPAGGRALHLGSHDAIRSIGPTVGPLHSCQVAIGVTGTSRVDVVANAGAGTSLACSVAIRTARLVEPNLP